MFKVQKDEKKVLKLSWKTLIFLIAISFVVLLKTHVKEIVPCLLFGLSFPKGSFLILTVFCLSVMCFLFLSFQLIKRLIELHNAGKIRISIKTKNSEWAENEKEPSLFDSDLHEIIYLFKHADSKIFVFEDMDRISCTTSLFTKLREVNELLNLDNEEDSFQFVYLIKDSTFEGKNRIKFFDIIIPIVPYVDSSNSCDILLKRLDKTNVSKDLIFAISIYIDEMRILINICNEFIIYKNNILVEGSEYLSEDKLFALITYKNLFPEDYENLQMDSGFLFTFFENAEKNREQYVKEIAQQIAEIKNKIETINDTVARNVEELNIIFSKKCRINVDTALSPDRFASYISSQSTREEYWSFVDRVKDKKSLADKIQELNKLERKKKDGETCAIRDLLDSDKIDVLFDQKIRDSHY